jgi:hypothetical protein
MELAVFLQALSSWLAGPAAWWLIDHVPWLKALQPDTKRYTAFALSAVIAAVGWFGLLAIGNITPPGHWVDWVSQLWLVMTSSFGLATLLNGPSLRKYRTD